MNNELLQKIVDDSIYKKVLVLKKEQIGEILAGKYLFVEQRNLLKKNDDGMIRHLSLSGHMFMFREVEVLTDLDVVVSFNGKKYVKSNLTSSVINHLFSIAKEE